MLQNLFFPMMSNFPRSLLDGYRSFKEDRFARQRARYRALAEDGQTPQVMVIACCDSRTAPETIFSAQPGKIFVVRNVANLVPPYEPDGTYHATLGSLRALRVAPFKIQARTPCPRRGLEALVPRRCPPSQASKRGG